MRRLTEINFQFPINTPEEADFYNLLWELFKKLPGAESGLNIVSISPKFPKGAQPKTVLEGSTEGLFPALRLDPIVGVNVNLGEMSIVSDDLVTRTTMRTRDSRQFSTESDTLGEYYQTWIGGQRYSLLDLAEFKRRFGKQILSLDHAGINLPANFVKKSEFNDLFNRLKKVANVYKHPGHPEWVFVLPSNDEELEQGITNFSKNREGKFEFVFDTYLKVPTIQFDLITKLSKEEVSKLLPVPYGISYPDVKDFFRTVYVRHPWNELLIRFDLRFATEEKVGYWESGEFLVKGPKK